MKTLLLFVATLAAVPAARAFDVNDLGTPVGRTPYDRYFGGVKQVLAQTASGRAQQTEVSQLVKRGRGFRYSFTTPYIPQTPDVTEATRTGDCKAKSLWLADRMNDSNVRFVVGKLSAGAKQSHAWLIWNDGTAWWVLDPTVASSPKRADRIGHKDWVCLFSYTKSGTYQHAATKNYAINWEHPEPIVGPELPVAIRPWWLQPLNFSVPVATGWERLGTSVEAQ